MAKSKKRGGEKAHKKRVQKRNQEIQGDKNRVQKIQREMLEQIMSEMREGSFDDTQGVTGSEVESNEDIELEL